METAAFQFAGQDIPWLLAGWAARQPDKTFLIWAPHSGPGRSWTYAEFWADVRRVAAGLAERGITPGDKVLLHADNCPEGLLTWYACATLGAVTVTTNTRSAPDEVTYFAEKTGCVAAVTQPEYADLVTAAAPDLKWIAVTDAFEALYGDPDTLPAREADPLAPAGILFTSGTTSRPKAVVHTHANALWAARIAPSTLRMTAADTYLVYLPFFHVNAQSWSIWTTLGAGGTIVLQPKFSTSRFWDVVTAHRVTHISLLPFVLNAILGQQPPAAHTLKAGVFGAVIPELDAALGFSVLPAFGMTETVTPAITAGPGLPPAPRSMGRSTPGYETLIVDPETGEVCADGRPGELRIRGTRGVALFAEYYDDPAATAKSFTDDGWFRTGDIVRLGETGDLVYCERDSDLLKVGGENVSAREVEDVCRQVPGVADVAVVGGPHPMLDEVPVAFVILRPDAADSGDIGAAVIDRCREALADFKVPRAVHVVDEFPRATLDKVAKNQLRDRARELAAH
ncbi:class I adenylate-forming enzyme family protein [Cryptosporangium aurantiacum]|uniref:Crotonobetaine/carnitine-CoA ligase n=1 Tax=Cryptosporangium aurantiacum TaxID=134849 RepID=A0A1M7R1D3_9ACTN|nr:AMP-binding protein [Cryptosporangium aurantiacum]SHN38414.1 crotonobetaine/carnitine-CoA ligase [Cryptosporangium aurantiacum]